MIESKILKMNEYDKFLVSLIPNLENFSYLQGMEGRAFFINENFIVKQYFSKEEDVFMFNKFCQEIKDFSDMGYSVPKIYSWIAIPDDYGQTDLFILEERVKGKILFNADMSSIFSRCKSFCSRKDFDYALEIEKGAPELFSQIAREYIKSYIEINEQLLNISDSELEKFIKSDHGMLTNSNYSIPDVQACNIIFDGKKLTMIDNGFLGNGVFCKDTPEQINSMVVRDMFLMFYENGSVQDIKTYTPLYSEEINLLKKRNSELCFESMRRFVRKATNMLDFKKLSEFDFYACWQISEEALGNNLALEVIKEVEKGD